MLIMVQESYWFLSMVARTCLKDIIEDKNLGWTKWRLYGSFWSIVIGYFWLRLWALIQSIWYRLYYGIHHEPRQCWRSILKSNRIIAYDPSEVTKSHGLSNILIWFGNFSNVMTSECDYVIHTGFCLNRWPSGLLVIPSPSKVHHTFIHSN